MLLVHLCTAIASDILLILTAIASILYLHQDYCLKHRKRIIALPSIQFMDLVSLKLLISAFILMSIGIIAGSVLAYQQWGDSWYLDPKQIGSIIAWAVFACVLAARLKIGWRGRVAVLTTLSGVTLVLIGFLTLHYFNWSHHYGF